LLAGDIWEYDFELLALSAELPSDRPADAEDAYKPEVK
jgi:hypothetical protein